MLSLSVSQAQRQFTSILSKATTIIDKKSNVKKAVILPYEMYEKLTAKARKKRSKIDLNKFVGILKSDFKTDDIRYNEIVK
jgi:hypothetical protein